MSRFRRSTRMRECQHCGTKFIPKRAHAEFHTDLCRAAWHRKRKKTVSAAQAKAEANSGSDEDALLLAIADNQRASFAGLAVALGWISAKGENKAKVKRCADRLKADKLVKPDRRGTLCLTEKGETEVKRLRSNSPAPGERFIIGETIETP